MIRDSIRVCELQTCQWRMVGSLKPFKDRFFFISETICSNNRFLHDLLSNGTVPLPGYLVFL